MQPVSFGAMLRINGTYYNPQQVTRVEGHAIEGTIMRTTEPHGEFISYERFNCKPETLVNALHEAQQTTDKPYIDLVV